MLVKLKLDSSNLVTAIAWANPNQRKAGDVTEDGFIIYEVDETEYQVCVANHTKLIDGHLVVDSDYTPPVMEMPEPTPSAQDQINAKLLKQTATNAAANAAIMKQIATMAAGYTATSATTQEA